MLESASNLDIVLGAVFLVLIVAGGVYWESRKRK